MNKLFKLIPIKHIIILFYVLTMPLLIIANKSETDSLKTVLTSLDNDDTTKIFILNNLSWKLKRKDMQTAFDYANKAIKINPISSGNYSGNMEIPLKKFLAKSYNNLGVIYKYKGELDTALEYYSKSYKLKEELIDKRGMAFVDYNVGVIQYMKGDYEKALEFMKGCLTLFNEIEEQKWVSTSYDFIGTIYKEKGVYGKSIENYFNSLKIRKEMSMKDSTNMRLKLKIANSYNNIAIVYDMQRDEKNALKYHFEALKIREEANDLYGMAQSYINIGFINDWKMKNYDKALDYYNKALDIYIKLGAKYEIAVAYNNIGTIYEKEDNYEMMLEYFNKSLILYEEMNNKNGIANTNVNIGIAYSKLGNYNKAISFCEKGLILAKELNAIVLEKNAYNSLSEAYEKNNNPKKALALFKEYSYLKDTIFNQDKSKELGKMEGKFESEMAQARKEFEEKEAARIKVEGEKRRNLIQNMIIFLGILVLVGGVFFSGKFVVSDRVLEAAIFFTVILIFEFILVILDPVIDGLSEGMPLLKLGANAFLALLIFPVHSFLEENMKKNIQRKRRILENIKMTMAQD